VVSFNYQIVKKKGLATNASINVSERKGVVVRVPFWMTKGMVEGFLKEKSDWIIKNLERLNSKKVVKKYEDGEKHLYFGQELTLTVVITPTPERCSVIHTDEYLQVKIFEGISKETQSDKIKEALLYWYLEKGIEVLTEKVNNYTKEIGVTYKEIKLKRVSSIWGSCSPTNCLSFNRKLVMAPHEIVDYVVIHEVAHMVHRNHGRGFWNLVEKYDPQYKNHRRWLKLNHHLLSI